MSTPKHTPYQTPKSEPSMVKYIERSLLATSMWADWVVLKTLVLSFTDMVCQRTGVTRSRAHLMIWNAFTAAVEQDPHSPVFTELQHILTTIPDSERPIFIGRLRVGVLIHRGQTPKKAETQFQEWLTDSKNATFGNYRLQADFTTVEVPWPSSSSET